MSIPIPVKVPPVLKTGSQAAVIHLPILCCSPRVRTSIPWTKTMCLAVRRPRTSRLSAPQRRDDGRPGNRCGDLPRVRLVPTEAHDRGTAPRHACGERARGTQARMDIEQQRDAVSREDLDRRADQTLVGVVDGHDQVPRLKTGKPIVEIPEFIAPASIVKALQLVQVEPIKKAEEQLKKELGLK